MWFYDQICLINWISNIMLLMMMSNDRAYSRYVAYRNCGVVELIQEWENAKFYDRAMTCVNKLEQVVATDNEKLRRSTLGAKWRMKCFKACNEVKRINNLNWRCCYMYGSSAIKQFHVIKRNHANIDASFYFVQRFLFRTEFIVVDISSGPWSTNGFKTPRT